MLTFTATIRISTIDKPEPQQLPGMVVTGVHPQPQVQTPSSGVHYLTMQLSDGQRFLLTIDSAEALNYPAGKELTFTAQ